MSAWTSSYMFFYSSYRSGHGLYLYSSGNRYKGQYLAGKKVNSMVVCHLFKAAIITKNGVILTSDLLGGFWSVLVDDWSPCRRKVCRTVCCWKEVIVIIIIIMITLHFKGRARAATTLEMVMFSQVTTHLGPFEIDCCYVNLLKVVGRQVFKMVMDTRWGDLNNTFSRDCVIYLQILEHIT